jgi:hypothetical protein
MYRVIHMKTNIWMIASVIFLIWAIGASAGTAYFYQISQNQQIRIANLESAMNSPMKVNILINYSNGTAIWYNNTAVSLDANLLNATEQIAIVNLTHYSFGDFVNSINGVLPVGNQFWGSYTYDSGNWIALTKGAGDYQLRNNEILKWELTSY